MADLGSNPAGGSVAVVVLTWNSVDTIERCLESVLGSDFYVMERLEGTVLGRDVPDGVELGPDAARRLSDRAWDTLVELHDVDVSAAPALASLDKGDGFVHRQVPFHQRIDGALMRRGAAGRDQCDAQAHARGARLLLQLVRQALLKDDLA